MARASGRARPRPLWALPLAFAAGGVALACITIAIDRATDDDLVPQSLVGTPTAAQVALQVIAQSIFTLSTVVLSLTLVVVQLAMAQFSPRIVAALLGDRRSQIAIGLFLGTFAFALLALREIDDQTGQVPGVTVLTAYVLALCCLVALLLYVHHAGQRMRVSGLIDLVGDETHHQLSLRYPAGASPPPPDDRIILAAAPGVVVGIDHDGLVEVARREGAVIELSHGMGEFVPHGAPLARVHDGARRVDAAAVRRMVVLGPERTHESDPPYGIRKLVDIAERSCSSPFDDPTTTVQALHRIHDCLRLLAPREIPDGRHRDAEGRLRLIVPILDWEGFVRLAFDEIRLAGAGSPQVVRRLRAALLDLMDVAPPERRPPLERQVRLLDAAVRRDYDDEDDVQAMLVPDNIGVGAGRDVAEVDR